MLKLTASDGASDTVTITVNPPASEIPSMIIRKTYSLAGVAVATRTVTDYPTLTDTDELQWLVADNLGSVTGVVNDDLSSAYKAWYYPYGTVRGETGATGIDQSFTGQTNDPGTGLIDYNARQYDPVVGRFIQRDTRVPNLTAAADFNRYMYVGGNPVSAVDPTGNETCTTDYKDCWDDAEPSLQGYGALDKAVRDLREGDWKPGEVIHPAIDADRTPLSYQPALSEGWKRSKEFGRFLLTERDGADDSKIKGGSRYDVSELFRGVAEKGLAGYAILVQDGEIMEGTGPCGQDLICILVPGSAPGGHTGFTQGNTLVIDSDKFLEYTELEKRGFLIHELKHLEDVREFGYLAWMASYVIESGYEFATGGDFYRDVTWEERARRASNAPNNWSAF